MKHRYTWVLLLTCIAACHGTENNSDDTGSTTRFSTELTLLLSYQVVNRYPHDTAAFTEGLFYYSNHLYESTGEQGHSRLRQITINGITIRDLHLPDELFGEGITRLHDKIYQLTWKNNKVLVYNAATFKKLAEQNWQHEGWGLANDGQQLIIGTGSDTLYFVNPADFKITRYITVSDVHGPVDQLNELEYIHGFIYANIWHKNDIVKIDPASGKVKGKISLTGLHEQNATTTPVGNSAEAVLNGIAFDSATNKLYITGKYWASLFELTVPGL